MLLARPRSCRTLRSNCQCDRWLQDLVAHDIDAALYLMFQLAATSSVGYLARTFWCAPRCSTILWTRAAPAPAGARQSSARGLHHEPG